MLQHSRVEYHSTNLEYIINHVFCPLKLPQGSDHSLENDLALSQVVLDTALAFSDELPSAKQLLWASSVKMLRNLKDSIRFSVMSPKDVESQINAMNNNDVLVYMIRAQNAAVLMRKLKSETIFESFEISPDPTAVMSAKGKLICSYPGPAITVPDTIIHNATFPAELANFLTRMDRDVLDAAATREKAGSTVAEERDTAHPRYITELLTGILRGLGSVADVPRIRKRIGDDVLWDSAKLPWRRSPLWLVIRVALQTTLERCALGRTTYKSFILFSMARLTTLSLDCDLPNDTLHFMSAKIARRLFKLGSSASPELSQMVCTVTSDVRSILEGRWGYVQDAQQASPRWAPETLQVLRDTHISLNTSREYICQALQNQHSSFQPTSFNPSYRLRGTIDDFLDADASFLVAAHAAEPSLSLIDFETVVRSGIDGWVARVSFQNIDSACVSIEAALDAYKENPENLSIMLLTLFELWVAMDKTVIRQIPLLTEYPPEIPLALWEHLLIRQSSALDRLKHHLSAFSSTDDDKSFAARYFYQSYKLRDLKLSIEADAQEEREKKLTELRILNENAANSSHLYGVNSRGWEYHASYCPKCGLEIHEWPLPQPCPAAFDAWRSMTFHVLISPTPPFMKLPQYDALQKYRQCHPRQRLTLANSHYSRPNIPTVHDRFRPFDITTDAWVADGPYDDLQRYLAGTSHTSNEVIANQADCHKDMTIHDGPRLQWMNVLRELHIHLLLAQAVSQVGPLSMPFIDALLGELEYLMASVEGNWLEGVTIGTIIMLVCRVLSSTQEESMRTFTLLRQLSSKMQASDDETVSQNLQGRVRDMAVTCRSTFDIDGDASLHLTSNDDMKVFAYCAVVIYDNTPSQPSDLSQHSKLLLERDKRCCHALEPTVRRYAELHKEGLDCAIAEIWSGYRPGNLWRALPAPNSRWLVTQTAPSYSQSPQDVHFNLVSGCLLVDGKQLGRLPSVIVQHPTYQSIFGNQILDIVPADIPGMEYATRGNVCDYHVSHPCFHRSVSFALRDSNDLIVRAKHIDKGSPILQLIPSQKFVDDLPTPLIVGHTHWLNLRTSEIEIRPAEYCWKSSPENWVLRFAVVGSSTLQNAGGATALVDIHSQTWDMISKRIHPLEDARCIMVTYNKGSSSTPFLKADLPRYGLEFFVDEDGELQSRNMRNMVVDVIQSTGTMLGLVNQLILRSKSQIADEHPRTVIIPDGRISYSANGHHVRVTIAPEDTRVAYHLYRVDADLRCLTGNAGLTSKLYQALLHAVTSGCLPDPLTGRTGSEEALYILHSAACRSFMKLRSRDTDLLSKISSLSTRRIWYPTNLRKMQTVSWSSLASLAQHHGFHPAAKSIMDYGMQLSTFSEESSNSRPSFDLPPSIDHLLERASIRASAVYPDQFSLPLSHVSTDDIYASRDVSGGHAEERAYRTAFMVHQWPSRLQVQRDLLSLLIQWKDVQGIGKPLSLQYSKDWLQPNFPQTHLQDDHALVPTLLAFATVPEIRSLGDPPKFTSYTFSDGFMPSDAILDNIERYLVGRPCEDERALGTRRYSAFQDKCRTEKQLILSKVRDAWPCEDPPALNTLQVNCYNLNDLSEQLRSVFHSCWRNRCLKQHLDTWMLLHRPHLDSPDIRMCGSSQFLHDSNRSDLVSSNSVVTARLQQLIHDFRDRGSNKFHRKYADDLDQSRLIFCEEKIAPQPDSTPYTMEVLLEYHSLHSRQFQDSLETIVRALSPTSAAENALYNAGLWPRVTPNFLFTHMASVSRNRLGQAWHTTLVRLSQILLQLQRSRRLLIFAAKKNWVEFFKELENEECDGFDPELYPDWLLIQIESQFLARPLQLKVALEMMSPCTGTNTSLQLNMGEGKSYVIVPLAAAALSDAHKLSLSAQMFQLLVERLSGLAQRRIFYIPFSRTLSIGSSKVQMYRDLMQECMDSRGILVVQPDHILSFHLMAVDRQLPPQTEVAEDILQTQLWLDDHTRDILDESDEILHVRYQLVYTVGLQRSLQGYPERWTTTQQVLSLVAKHAPRLMSEFPSHSEVSIRKHGTFPFIRVLHSTAGENLVQWIAQDVISGALGNINFDQASLSVKQAVRQFIATEEISNTCIGLVEERYRDTTVWPGLLVLRGLLACGILVYALKERRWRVDYGLAPKRTMLAVPFRAKDMPSLRAEFGHPDIAVTLTCLSYYYAGLTLQQLMLCFELLLKQDNPALEYESWVLGLQSVPESLRHLSGINTESAEQLRDLQQLFASNKAVIDFYLSRVVFPKEAKGFPNKLTCSGWDLAQEKRHLTTGFSGTNDNRYLLPSSMRSTNARVLAFLLRPENDCLQMHTARPKSKRDAQAAVFVNDDDEIVIVSRNGTVEPFASSPFSQQLDQCVVYLDDAHTRGTDVKLPSGFRAAVTLGPKVTKDRLTQGCMRMRKLGNGHSVMFFAPTEVDRSIRSATQKANTDCVDVADILYWAMRETCLDIQMRASHWAQQGSDFSTRHSAWIQFSHAPTTSISTLETAWLQPEERSLEDLYAPRSSLQLSQVCDPDVQKKCEELGVLLAPERSMDEEQEREIVHEVERERQVERPPRVEPAAHELHAHVLQFVQTGQIPAGSSAFIPEDDYLRPVNWVIIMLVVVSPYEANTLLPDIRRSNAVHLCIYTPRTTKNMQACNDLRLYCVPSTPRLTPQDPLIFQLDLFAGQLYFSNYEMYLRVCSFLGLNAPDLGDKDLIADSDGFISEENRPSARASCSFKRSQLPALKELFGMRRKGMGYLPTHVGKMLNGRILTEEDFLD
ncbi:uncharacterized protein EDB91DRAFT_1234945 [Suillus paluster]|uniref:uncharacterized protein n=1 Tax=Suillus paluster TaxID=48578 RepID=UPI001B885BF5|nr:uncharacterized protein EDB91DRAFT_1234945 [Suillus paluster]KAG1750324.1 hypothetical protein EDB91DRAFT_1234945 [Suillus paluster]